MEKEKKEESKSITLEEKELFSFLLAPSHSNFFFLFCYNPITTKPKLFLPSKLLLKLLFPAF